MPARTHDGNGGAHPAHKTRAKVTRGGHVIAGMLVVAAFYALYLDNAPAVFGFLVGALIAIERVEPSMLFDAWKEWRR